MAKISLPLDDLFKEAFEAGEKYGMRVDHLPYPPDFDEWLAALKERVRKEVRAPEGLITTFGNLDVYFGQ